MNLGRIFYVAMLACMLWPLSTPAGPVETRFGLLDVVEGRDRSENGLSLNGNQIDGVEGYFDVTHVFDWGNKGDVVLLAFWSGGASCCHSYQIIHVTEQDAFVTSVFGERGSKPSNFAAGPTGISFRLELSFPASVDHLEIHYDGAWVQVTTVWEDDSNIEMAGTGEQVLRWAGQHPYIVFDNPSERVRFRQIMTNDELDILRTSISVAGKSIEISGGYILGAGCWPHFCPSSFGFFAIEIATGQPFAVYCHNFSWHFFGASAELLPEELQDMIEGRRGRSHSGRKGIGDCTG